MSACLYSQEMWFVDISCTLTVAMLPEFYHLELSKVHNMWQSYLETEINHYMYFDACCSHIVGFKVLYLTQASLTVGLTHSIHVSIPDIPSLMQFQ